MRLEIVSSTIPFANETHGAASVIARSTCVQSREDVSGSLVCSPTRFAKETKGAASVTARSPCAQSREDVRGSLVCSASARAIVRSTAGSQNSVKFWFSEFTGLYDSHVNAASNTPAGVVKSGTQAEKPIWMWNSSS